jgi:shikimate kinase
MPGSGKSKLGKKLAKKLDYTFLDLDKEIEKKSGLSIPKIFEQWGEDHFRVLERDILFTTATLNRTIIATGGGAPCFYHNMEWMNLTGHTIYLKCSLQILLRRLHEKSKKPRPLLPDSSGIELEKQLKTLYLRRKMTYDKAQSLVNIVDNHPLNLENTLHTVQKVNL